jgi:hypothetical protein
MMAASVSHVTGIISAASNCAYISEAALLQDISREGSFAQPVGHAVFRSTYTGTGFSAAASALCATGAPSWAAGAEPRAAF